MSVDFKIKKFFYPVSILKLRSFLEKSQWFSQEELESYQLKRLQLILEHSYQNVPYYQELFDKLSLKPQDIKSLDDLKRIPLLTKDVIRKKSAALTAKNAGKFKPFLCKTSGASGESLEFYLNKSSNILEFCYYWRYWSWAGYKLGMPFAEFSLHHFLDANVNDIAYYSRFTNRLFLNPAQISSENIDEFLVAIKKRKPLFLKGAPSTLYIFSILLEKKGYDGLSLRAIFTTGELLLPYQREKIEEVFNCKIFDSYGHMERTVAISQCSLGNYHVNSEYGIFEVERDEELSSGNKVIGQVVGTSLHNFAMPLIRYRTGDLVEIDLRARQCECGRGLPLVKRIHGRQQDIIVTREGKFITNAFIFFNFWKGVLLYQLIQENIDEFELKLVRNSDFNEDGIAERINNLRCILGGKANIKLQFINQEEVNNRNGKFRPIVSKVNIEEYV